MSDIVLKPEAAPYFRMDGDRAMINMDALRKNVKLLVGAPAFAGMMSMFYHQCFMRLKERCMIEGIECEEFSLGNESDIHRARNTIAALFLKGHWTHLLFWDVDEEVNYDDILMMIAMNLSVIGGLIPLKGIDDRKVWNAAYMEDRIYTPSELLAQGLNYAIFDDGKNERVNGAISVRNVGTGLMLIQRRVLEEIIASGQAEPYTNTPPGMGLDKAWWIFRGMVVDGHYKTEDYALCEQWRRIGGRVWAYPHGSFGHWGNYMFRGSPQNIVRAE